MPWPLEAIAGALEGRLMDRGTGVGPVAALRDRALGMAGPHPWPGQDPPGRSQGQAVPSQGTGNRNGDRRGPHPVTSKNWIPLASRHLQGV